MTGDSSYRHLWDRTSKPPLVVYDQPPCPEDGYFWSPGYWAYGDDGYFWVPGIWVEVPQPGYYWTPGYCFAAFRPDIG
jgi:hypothetical protein